MNSKPASRSSACRRGEVDARTSGALVGVVPIGKARVVADALELLAHAAAGTRMIGEIRRNSPDHGHKGGNACTEKGDGDRAAGPTRNSLR